MSQARPSSRMTRPKMAKTPAAAPTAVPRRILVIFSETSALASSISSRTRTLARSEISWTAAAIWGPSSGCPGSGAKALDEEGEGDAAHEGRADEELDGRPPGGRADAGDGRSGLEGRQAGVVAAGAVAGGGGWR